MTSSSFNNMDGAEYNYYRPTDYIAEIVASRRGNIVSIMLNGARNLTPATMHTVMTLPPQYRPYREVRNTSPTGEATPRSVFCQIGTDGVIKVYNYATTQITSANLTMQITYPLQA